MSRYRRALVEGGTYFLTVVTHQRQPLLTHEPVMDSLRGAFRTVRRECPFVIEACVVLPDHFHLLMTLPPGDADYATRLSIIKRRVAQANCNLLVEPPSRSVQRRRELGFWQRRFWEHLIRDDDDFARHVDYIHFNPVKHGLVERVCDWPYSTFHRWVEPPVGGEGNLSPGLGLRAKV